MGEVVAQLMIAGGKHMPFVFSDLSTDVKFTTERLMTYGSVSSLKWWKGASKCMGACRFQKVIYFN